MKNLAALNCSRPKKDEGLESHQIEELHHQVPEWNISEIDGILQLSRIFPFKNFAHALTFTNQVGALAEKEDHHPAILTEWGKVTVTFWTHFIKGLHLNDFIAAAKTNTLYNPAEES